MKLNRSKNKEKDKKDKNNKNNTKITQILLFIFRDLMEKQWSMNANLFNLK